MGSHELILPGDSVPEALIPSRTKSSKGIKVGPGLRYTPPDKITTAVPGEICVDARKHSLWVETNGRGRVRAFRLSCSLMFTRPAEVMLNTFKI